MKQEPHYFSGGRSQIDGKMKIYSDLKKAQEDSNIMRRIVGLPKYDYDNKTIEK